MARAAARRAAAATVRAAPNDNLSKGFALVPEAYRDTDEYLNIVQWNIEWFGARRSAAKDVRRGELVLDILTAFNADLFVFQEVAGPTPDARRAGVLDDIADRLSERGAGDYAVDYTHAGGEQRVAMMWDRDYLRTKRTVEDLFPEGAHRTADGKDAFATRTPLHGYFEAKVGPATRFDFQALGVHLKAMGNGQPQREVSARVLADWMEEARRTVDADILITGDWNAPPDAAEWEAIRSLPNVSFEAINDASDFSYLWLENQTTRFTSRIDLTALSLASDTPVPQVAAHVVHWTPIEEAIARASGRVRDKEVRAVLAEIKETVSDHLPTITQFYFKRRR